MEEAIAIVVPILASLVASRRVHNNISSKHGGSASSRYEALEKHHLRGPKNSDLLTTTTQPTPHDLHLILLTPHVAVLTSGQFRRGLGDPGHWQ